jgi:hypothetical protein
MVGAVISANPLQLDFRSHKKCMFICCVITMASFQYGLVGDRPSSLQSWEHGSFRNPILYTNDCEIGSLTFIGLRARWRLHGNAWLPSSIWLLQ